MKSVMHFRSKEMNKRSAFDGSEMGKRQIDAWNKDKVYVDRPKEGPTMSDLFMQSKTIPRQKLDYRQLALSYQENILSNWAD